MSVRDDARFYKQFAQSAYEKNLNKIKPPEGWVLDKEKSGKKIKVFLNPEEKKVITSFRGTNDKHDVATDLTAVVSGNKKNNKYFKTALKKQNMLSEAYPEYDKIITGHSLGGSVAEYVNKKAKEKPNEVFTYSKGIGLQDYFKKRDDNQVDSRAKGDPISLGALTQKGGKYIEGSSKGQFNPHSIQNLFE